MKKPETMGILNRIFGKNKTAAKPSLKYDDKSNLDEPYGIDKDRAHQRAIQLIPEEFFWSNFDELAPFGSDEGDMALAEFREWRTRNPKSETLDFLRLTIENLTDKGLSDYNQKVLDESSVSPQEDLHQIFIVDTSVIATGFAQLVDEGKIDNKNKPIVELALKRQKLYATKFYEWQNTDEYLKNLVVLERVLKEA
ncbi:hypothetical protein [Halocola ammonii]